MFGPHRRAIEHDHPAALENAIDDGMGQVIVVQDTAPCSERFVGGKHHRALFPMPIVDDVEQHVRRVRSVREVAHLVDHEYGGMDVGRQRLGKATAAESRGEVINEFGRGDTPCVEAILDRAIRNRHREMCLAAPGFPAEDDAATLGDEVWRECGAEEGQPDGRLIHEVEIVDRLQKGETGPSDEAVQPRLLAMSDFFRDQQREEVTIAPLLLLGAPRQLPPGASHVGQVQPFD